MVCVAAFIILCLVGIVVAFLSIFKREIGKKYLKVFKKAWHCVFKKVRLQKCDTNFKDDVKNTILRKVILKKPKLVKPLSVIIEIVSVLIVLITVWSLVIAIKSLLSLWTLGTCNPTKPSACSLTSESCSIDEEEATGFFGKIGQSFGQWGEIFGAIPDRLKTWTEDDLSDVNEKIFVEDSKGDKTAIDIIDPGCIVCLKSFNNQKDSGFFENYKTYLVFYPITNSNGEPRFKNSINAVRFMTAVSKKSNNYAYQIINHLFTEKDSEKVSYQTRLNNDWSEEDMVKNFESWLKDFGMKKDEIKEVEKLYNSDEIKDLVEKNKQTVEDKVHPKSIPVEIYDGKKHNGLFKK